MKIYLAARFIRQPEMEEHAKKLNAAGHEVVSRWVFGGEEGLTKAAIAILDLVDVQRSDVVISFTHPHGTLTPGGGRHVEFGYGLALKKQAVLIGERENVFHHHPDVTCFHNIEEWISHEAINV